MQKFSFKELPLKDAYLISPFFSEDERGGFIKDYSFDIFNENGIFYELKEVFYTISHKGVIRAIHFQEINHQPKLVRCIRGKVFDVIVDLRPESPTFKEWFGVFLSGTNMQEILVPAHFGHGYLVLEESIVSYKTSAPFDPKNDSGIKYDDPDLNIKWPFELLDDDCSIIISEKDKKLQSFRDYFGNGCK